MLFQFCILVIFSFYTFCCPVSLSDFWWKESEDLSYLYNRCITTLSSVFIRNNENKCLANMESCNGNRKVGYIFEYLTFYRYLDKLYKSQNGVENDQLKPIQLQEFSLKSMNWKERTRHVKTWFCRKESGNPKYVRRLVTQILKGKPIIKELS